MKFPIFATFIVFGLWAAFSMKRSTSESEKKEEDFKLRERKANAARKQPLDHLAYITIPFEKLPADPLHLEDKNSELQSLFDKCHFLQEQGIVDLTGKTNTDLKLDYGVGNLETLMDYDQNFSTLLITLNQIGHLYYDNGNTAAATSYLEYAVSLHTDVSATYSLLSKIYQEEGNPRKIEHLLPIAEDLQSGTRQKIVNQLKEALS